MLIKWVGGVPKGQKYADVILVWSLGKEIESYDSRYHNLGALHKNAWTTTFRSNIGSDYASFMILQGHRNGKRTGKPPVLPKFESNGILLPKLIWPTVKKNVLEIEKFFEIHGWRPRICKFFEITCIICSNSQRSEQFLVTEFTGGFSNLRTIIIQTGKK